MFRTTRAIPAAVLAAVVLLVAMAGGATAAKLITGKQIKDNSVTTQDIKNGSLKSADLAPIARTGVKWAHDDTTGVDLPNCTDTALDECATLLKVAIVPGTQLVTASGSIDNTSGVVPSISNRCGLMQGGVVLTEARFALAANSLPGEIAGFTLQQVISVPDASLPVSLRCTEMDGEALRLVEPRLTSLKVS